MRWILVGALLAVGCNSNPYPLAPSRAEIPPPAPATMTGRYYGRAVVNAGTGFVSAPVFVRLTQRGTAVSGEWQALGVVIDLPSPFLAGQGVGGEIVGSVRDLGNRRLGFDGTIAWEGPGAQGVRCIGSGQATGSAQNNTVSLSAARITFSQCGSVSWSATVELSTAPVES